MLPFAYSYQGQVKISWWELPREKKVESVRCHKEEYGLNQVLKALRLSKSTCHYEQQKQAYEAKYHHLRKPLLEIAMDHLEMDTGEPLQSLNWKDSSCSSNKHHLFRDDFT